MIRAVVVNWNGGDRTLACLRSVLGSTRPPGHDLEVVLVDNASSDGIAGRVEHELPEVRVLRNSANLGFAGGVNAALDDLDGLDHIALVNNDAVVEPEWLLPLAGTLESDPTIGAVCPKILLADQYLEVGIKAPATSGTPLDPRPLGVRVSAVRVGDDDVWSHARFVSGFYGPEAGDPPESSYQWTGPHALLRVPVAADGPIPALELRLAATESKEITLHSGALTKVHLVGPDPVWFPAPLDGEPFDVINNVGTTLVRDAYGADRGWLERDHGQYDDHEEVFAWCGAAVLLRAEYLRDVGGFDQRLFLYGEDLELSWRGRARGWRYLSAPESTVRHEHAATSGEHSPAKTYYDERNHLLVVTRHGDFRLLARTLLRYLLVTASYARRDVIARVLERRRARTAAVRARLRALAGFVRLAPAMVAARREQR